ncbi:MAG: Z1 domain-containing protein [Solibacillus sp.]
MKTLEKIQAGEFFNTLTIQNEYDDSTVKCVFNTTQKLIELNTDLNRPGMLLGKIQSGKTRTFIGITGLCFDNGYDAAIYFTKGTKALAQQTFERLKSEFQVFYKNDKAQIFDIMNLPSNLSNYELDQKLLIVVKKETNNLARLTEAIFETYPQLANKKILIIDDEADFASVGFSKSKNEATNIKIIAGQIDDLRKNLNNISFLQVTATPYSLYLQPEDLVVKGSNKKFVPIKPAFTELVPVPKAYIGGEYYFEASEDETSVAAHIYEPIKETELDVLKKEDRRKFKIEDVLTSKRVHSLREAVVNFIVGGVIRRLQDINEQKNPQKYSFIIHTEQGKAAHEWQESIVFELKKALQSVVVSDPEQLKFLIEAAYENLVKSLNILECYVPTFTEVIEMVKEALLKDHLVITKVNSEKQIAELLDETGQLKLRTPLNIYIGGQILDRGITISNLIGFYYGRNPQKFQQDTVLQHSRMFGYRPIEDLAVTRFYTTMRIYEAMKRMHEIDTALREAFEKGANDNGVIFIEKDNENKIIPCSPNKILISNTTTLKPLKRLLPVGFQTKYKTHIAKTVQVISNIVEKEPGDSLTEPFLMDLEQAIEIINLVKTTHDDNAGNVWDEKAFISAMEYLSVNTDSDLKGKVWCIVRKNRNIGRVRSDGRFEDAPDTPKGEKGELTVAKKIAKNIPVLMLLHQIGEEGEDRWRGAEFWWPVLLTPEKMETVIYSNN